jgi:uncharacterized delta-60 repeat protein
MGMKNRFRLGLKTPRAAASMVRRAVAASIESLESRTLFDGIVGPFDNIPPAASIVPPAQVTTYRGSSETIEVYFFDNAAVNVYSISPANLKVVGPGGNSLAVTSVSTNPTNYAAQIIADYTVAAPSGGWTSSNNGTYAVVLLGSTQGTGGGSVPNAVTDTSGNPVPAESTAFSVDVPTAPTASIATPANITAQTSAPESVVVNYTDENAVKAASIGTGNLTVTGPGGQTLPVTAVSVTGSSSNITATYTIAPPASSGNVWDPTANGTYSVTLLPNQVTNVGGVPAASASTQFTVNVPIPPVAALAAPAEITNIVSAPQTVVATYTDVDAVNANSISTANLSITAPNGQPLIVTGVSVTPPGNVGSITATYTVAPPSTTNNLWEPADNGTYAVTLLPNQVTNVGGAPAVSVSSQFIVNIPTPPPAVDTGFDGGGNVNSGFVSESAAVQPDGKIVLVGRIGDIAAGTSQAVVERLNANGSVDTTFGNNGLITSAAGANDADYAVAIESDGSIVTAGTYNGAFAVERYLPGGTPDPSFATGGRVVTSLGGTSDTAYCVAVAPDGSIVAAGSSAGSFAFVRYLSDGSLDTFFGQRGIALFGMGGNSTSNVVGGLALEPDGSIVAAGASNDNVALIRLTADGQEVTSFAGGGAMVVAQLKTPQNLTAPDPVDGVAIQANGQILVANTSVANHFAVARINANGSLDTTFGTNGIATANFGGDDDADAVIAQPTGEILAVGTTDAGGTPLIAVAAFGQDGTLDPSFGTGGLLTLPTGIAAPPGSLGTQAIHLGDLFLHAFGAAGANGKLVVGSTNDAAVANTSSGLRRLNVPGAGLIGSFGAVNGKNRKLSFVDNNGVLLTLALKGVGSGQAFFDGSAIDLVLSGTGASTMVSIKSRGARSQVDVRNVQADGGLKEFSAGTALLSGTFAAGGSVGSISLLGLSGTIGVAGSIGELSIGKSGLANANILAGANLGSDGQLGGTGTAADTFAAAVIGKLKVAGAVAGSLIAAGLDPTSDVLLAVGDTVVGGTASRIGFVSVHGGVDAASHFIAGAFGSVAIPKKVKDLAADSRFEVL